MRRTLAVSAPFVALLVLAMIPATSAAGGGGTSLTFDREYYVVGDTVHARAQAWSGFDDAGSVQDGPYTAYLVRKQAFGSRLSLPADAIRLSPVSVTSGSEGRINISTTFRVPEVASGRWYVRVCNAGCRQAPGDLYDWGFSVASNATELQWMQRFDGLERKLSHKPDTAAVRAIREDYEELRKQIGAMQGDLTATAGGTEERIGHLERNTFEAVPWLVWLTVIVGVFAIVFAITAMRLRGLLKRLLDDPIVALHAQLAPDVDGTRSREPAGAR